VEQDSKVGQQHQVHEEVVVEELAERVASTVSFEVMETFFGQHQQQSDQIWMGKVCFCDEVF
jgi:hypothetical protein